MQTRALHQPVKGVLVTGAAGGIGRALCAAFTRAGYYVVGTDRVNARVRCDRFVRFDLRQLVTKRAAAGAFRRRVRAALDGRPLCALINNAAVQILGGVEQLTPSGFTGTLAVNLIAPFLLVRSFLRDLKRVHGSVVNIGSVHASLTKPGFAAYASSKAGLLGLTRALALELGPAGVRVNIIQPAATRTGMLIAGFKGDRRKLNRLAGYHPLGRIAEPREIAGATVFLVSDQAAFITGAAIDMDGGISARLHDPD
ncbi:MAG: SDR family oxidoreductase [Gammaproteobacteria bacterium]|nr:SDR family oxidoreductase [Gammaproteobacteria bacterium]